MTSTAPSPTTMKLRQSYGRTINDEDTTYALPADEPEWARLDIQHKMHKLALGSLFAPEELVRSVLAPTEGVQKAILDVGTGSGIWAIDMALEFPHAQVVGLDLAPHMSRAIPLNCRFEVGDMTKDLNRYPGKFDVIHVRSCSGHVPNNVNFMEDLVAALRHGGLLLFVDGGPDLFGEDKERVLPVAEGQPGHSWMASLLADFGRTMTAKGANPYAGYELQSWLEACPSLTNVGAQKVYTPIGPWYPDGREDSERMQAAGAITAQNLTQFVLSIRPTLIESGMPKEEVDRCILHATEELTTVPHHLYARWYYSWGQKAERF